jgi:hypothetical protein
MPRSRALVTMERYHRSDRAETKSHCVKLLGQRLIARAFEHQVAELQIRVSASKGYTAPDPKVVG